MKLLTPKQVVEKLYEASTGPGPIDAYGRMRAIIASFADDVRREEREACAKVAESWSPTTKEDWDCPSYGIAKAIREGK